VADTVDGAIETLDAALPTSEKKMVW
jgi:hypothetical protein